MTITEQPAPAANGHPPIADLVCRDLGAQPHLGGHRVGVRARIRERAEHGRRHYGTYLQPFNARDALHDLEDEVLDACQYAKQAVYEREAAAPTDPDLPALRALYGDLLHMACAIREMRTRPAVTP